MSVKEKGIVQQYVAGNNPRLFKNLKLKRLEEELDEFLVVKNFEKEISNKKKVLVLFGEAGSGKSLSLQLRFIQEIFEWDASKPLPIFFNLANEVDLEEVIKKINNNLSCNLQLKEFSTQKEKKVLSESVHLFIDSYDENSRIGDRDIIKEYLGYFSKDEVKILITCRTGYKESETLMKDSEKTTISYIAPIDFNGQEDFNNGVSDWIVRERPLGGNLNIKIKNRISELIKRLSLRENMGTGLMFDIIMRILTEYILSHQENDRDGEGII